MPTQNIKNAKMVLETLKGTLHIDNVFGTYHRDKKLIRTKSFEGSGVSDGKIKRLLNIKFYADDVNLIKRLSMGDVGTISLEPVDDGKLSGQVHFSKEPNVSPFSDEMYAIDLYLDFSLSDRV